jgi:hypothetical protein
MLNAEASKKALKKLFRKHTVMNLQQLSNTLNTSSRMSIFRRLKMIGYCSSYTHKGAYYTLSDTPKFDNRGLWFFQGIGFSHAGTLKATVIELVEHSEAGYTHRELEAVLHVRIHNTLLILVRNKNIERKRIEKQFVYCSANPQKAAGQTDRRRQLLSFEVDTGIAIPEGMIIEVLLEIIRAGQVPVSPTVVKERLLTRQISISINQVEQVYKRYRLNAEKKIPISTS